MEPAAASPVARTRIADRHRSRRPSHASFHPPAAVPDRPPAAQRPDPARQPGLAGARAHRVRTRPLRDRRRRQPPRNFRQRAARRTAGAGELRPHRFRRAGFLPAPVHDGWCGTAAPDGAGGRARSHIHRTRPGRRPGQAARRAGPGAHPAKFVFAGRRSRPGGGYGARRHRLRARLPAAQEPATAWRPEWPATGTATSYRSTICACRAPSFIVPCSIGGNCCP